MPSGFHRDSRPLSALRFAHRRPLSTQQPINIGPTKRHPLQSQQRTADSRLRHHGFKEGPPMTLALASVNPAAGYPISDRLSHDIRATLATIALHVETLERLAGANGTKA